MGRGQNPTPRPPPLTRRGRKIRLDDKYCGYDRMGVMKQKGTYQPKKRSHAKVHGFLTRMSTHNGRKIIKKRMVKGRKVLTVSDRK